jgi:iron complex transport system substrate-binding protein
MRICSLIPGATELVAALGLADELVGISHECDFPPTIQHVPVMIEPMVGKDQAPSAEIDRRVKELAATGARLYRLKEEAFCRAQPDVVLSQDLCHVCAVTPDQLTHAIQSLHHPPMVVTFSPTTLEGMINDVERIAKAIDRLPQGQAFANSLRHRLDLVHARTVAMTSRPRVVCVEWLAPLYVAGHWVPEMVELAGGHNVLGSKDAPSRETTWHEVEAAQPDLVLVMPCGFSIERTIKELARPGQVREEWRRAREYWPQTYVVDAASYFSRPGPRLVDGVELLTAILHPSLNDPIDPTRAIQLRATPIAMDAAS